MQTPTLPFRLDASRREHQLALFNSRKEIHWFGFRGAFREPGLASVTFTELAEGMQGGGGTAAVNGGGIAAGFDAAFVLAGLGHYDSDIVITVELSIKFLSLALVSDTLSFNAHVVRSGKNFAFAEGFLADGDRHLAVATAIVAPPR
jgi:acyl-coenzyme A thioesterase PaaI-like protein